VLSLFQLYPNVYFHKATKAAEGVFTALMLRLVCLVRAGEGDKAGLGCRHPIRRFIDDPEDLDNVLALDDAVFWGALPMLVEAEDRVLADYAQRLMHRRLPKCIDVRQWFEQRIHFAKNAGREERLERSGKILLSCNNVIAAFSEWVQGRRDLSPPTFIDQDRRTPYKKFQDSQSLLNQILIRSGTEYVDMAEFSPVVASAETFEVCRVYITEGDTEARHVLGNIMGTEASA
jgi:HD superfamily phosphohydrolase